MKRILNKLFSKLVLGGLIIILQFSWFVYLLYSATVYSSMVDALFKIASIVLAVKDGKVLVEGIGMVTKHTKPSAANQQGGIVNKEAYIDASNVMLLYKGKATRVGFKMDGDKKVRVAKATGEVID